MGLVDLLRLLRPEEVAERIASGKLDMRPEAVAERREALFPDTFYSGSTSPDILENLPTNMAPQYLWASKSPALAASYAGRRLNRRPDEAPTIYPLAVNTEGFDRVLGGGATWNTLRDPTVLRGSERISMDGMDTNTEELIDFSYESGVPGILFQDIIDPGPYQKLMNLGVPSASGGRASQREIDEFLRELESNPPLNMAVPDTTRVRAKYGAAFDPDYTGPNILGGAALPAVAGLLAAGQSDDADAGFVTKGGKTLLEAWHGSPHKFDRFSMDAIGTGEGAQAYGHGLYFADAQDLGKGYRDALKIRHDPREGINKLVNDVGRLEQGMRRVRNKKTGAIMAADPNNPVHNKILSGEIGSEDYEILPQSEGLMASVITAMKEDPRLARFADNKDIVDDVISIIRGQENGGTVTDKALEAYRRIDRNLPEAEGALYRVEIDVTPESLLDWDKPLSEQPRAIQKIAAEGVPEFQGFIDELAGINPEAAELAEKMMYGPESVRAGTEEASQNWRRLGALVGDSDIDLNRLHDVTDAAYGRRDKWGGTFYEELAGSPAEASGLLSDRGIKGIKYLDGNSRAVGHGTSNYVIFDDSLINIVERGYADPRLLTGTAAGTAGLLAAAPSFKEGFVDPIMGLLEAMEMPASGIHGLTRVAYGLLSGEDLDAALNRGADIVNMGVDASSELFGDEVLRRTGSPGLATGGYMGGLLADPLGFVL